MTLLDNFGFLTDFLNFSGIFQISCFFFLFFHYFLKIYFGFSDIFKVLFLWLLWIFLKDTESTNNWFFCTFFNHRAFIVSFPIILSFYATMNFSTFKILVKRRFKTKIFKYILLTLNVFILLIWYYIVLTKKIVFIFCFP